MSFQARNIMEPMILDNKEWQTSVTAERRLHLVNNLIQAMNSLQETNTTVQQDLFNQANLIENQIFGKAVSRADYYNNIAQQVYKIKDNFYEQAKPNSSTDIEDLVSNINLSELTCDDGYNYLSTNDNETTANSEIEDLFAHLNLNELSFEDESNSTSANSCENLSNSEQENKVTIYRHIKLWYILLHAFECMVTNTEDVQCEIAYCSKFRNLLIHISICPQFKNPDEDCNDYNCNSSRVLLAHCSICKQENCLVCKKDAEFKKPIVPSVEKDWHNTCTFELRVHLINKLIDAVSMFPSIFVAAYMQKVEKELFETANSRFEYYDLLAQIIYKLQKQFINRNAL